jgi:hypothetical protein
VLIDEWGESLECPDLHSTPGTLDEIVPLGFQELRGQPGDAIAGAIHQRFSFSGCRSQLIDLLKKTT